MFIDSRIVDTVVKLIAEKAKLKSETFLKKSQEAYKKANASSWEDNKYWSVEGSVAYDKHKELSQFHKMLTSMQESERINECETCGTDCDCNK
jgi:hypothetical protein